MNFFQFQAYINADVPGTSCSSCPAVASVPVLWARKGSGFTLLFEAFALTLARQVSVKAIKQICGVADDRLWRIPEHHVDAARTHEFYDEVKRWVTLKSPAKLSKKQLTDFHYLTHANLQISRAWRIKVVLRYIYANAQNSAQAETLFVRWCSWARRSRLEPFKKLALTVRKHMPGILAHFDSGLSNGQVERIDSLNQAAKSRARRYRTSKNLITITFLIAGKLKALPENPMLALA